MTEEMIPRQLSTPRLIASYDSQWVRQQVFLPQPQGKMVRHLFTFSYPGLNGPRLMEKSRYLLLYRLYPSDRRHVATKLGTAESAIFVYIFSHSFIHHAVNTKTSKFIFPQLILIQRKL